MKRLFLGIISMLFLITALANDIEKKLIEKDPVKFKDVKVENTEIKDLYKVKFTNGQNIYYHFGGDFFLNGEVFKFNNDFVNITKKDNRTTSKQHISDLINKYSNSLVHYPSTAKETLATIYVFSDFTCPYCKKFHQNIGSFQASGVDIYYIPFPRRSMGDYATVRGLQKIMCSKDKSSEFSLAFENPKNYIANVKTDDINCPEALDILPLHEYADLFKVKGTPTMITKNGSIISGFQTAEQFAYDLRKAIVEEAQ